MNAEISKTRVKISVMEYKKRKLEIQQKAIDKELKMK